ncbi:MAG: hypothetical protein O7G87_16165 [bacterium]|nr:hypothetical protein [bacterium]
MTISLDPIRDDLIAWAESLWLEDTGTFRNGASIVPSLPSSLFITYILYSMDALDAVACDRARWIAWIQSQQSEQDGSFAFPPKGSSRPRRGIALWNAVRALNMLGAQVARFPAYQREAMTVDGLRAWFATWKVSGNTHHEVLALVPTLASHPDAAWVEAFFEALVEQQHPALGTWPKEDAVNISRTFAYSLIHMGMDRLPPQAEKIVDAMLDLQAEDGFWHGRPAYSTMDAVYLLSRLAKAIQWREAEANSALHRVVDALIPYYVECAARDKSDTHQFAAVVQTFALLSQALPERFTTSRPWRFGWGNRAFWRCRVIKEELDAHE